MGVEVTKKKGTRKETLKAALEPVKVVNASEYGETKDREFSLSVECTIHDHVEEVGRLLSAAYAAKPSMETYDAQIHLDQLRRSIAAAKL